MVGQCKMLLERKNLRAGFNIIWIQTRDHRMESNALNTELILFMPKKYCFIKKTYSARNTLQCFRSEFTKHSMLLVVRLFCFFGASTATIISTLNHVSFLFSHSHLNWDGTCSFTAPNPCSTW